MGGNVRREQDGGYGKRMLNVSKIEAMAWNVT